MFLISNSITSYNHPKKCICWTLHSVKLKDITNKNPEKQTRKYDFLYLKNHPYFPSYSWHHLTYYFLPCYHINSFYVFIQGRKYEVKKTQFILIGIILITHCKRRYKIWWIIQSIYVNQVLLVYLFTHAAKRTYNQKSKPTDKKLKI